MKKNIDSMKSVLLCVSFMLLLTIIFSMTVMASTLPPGYSPELTDEPTQELVDEVPEVTVPLDVVTITESEEETEYITNATVPLTNIEITEAPPKTNPGTGDNILTIVILLGTASLAAGTYIFNLKRKDSAK